MNDVVYASIVMHYHVHFFYFFVFSVFFFFFFFFQAGDGILDGRVTGVQTCALPIYPPHPQPLSPEAGARGARAGDAMNRALVNRIADAVLYEGYILYPYRPSLKNRQRWTFGGRSEERRVGTGVSDVERRGRPRLSMG